MLTQTSQISANTPNQMMLSVQDFERLVKDHNSRTEDWKSFASKALNIFKGLRENLKNAQGVIAEQQKAITELEKLADSDCLTGLANRRQFERAFHAEIERVNRGKSRGGLLVMIDLDNFKQINDHFGHQAGDACLQLVAELLQKQVRTLDLAARLGGDEFVLIFSDAEADAAIDRTQEIAMALNKLCLSWQGDTIEIRASVGLRSFSVGDEAEHIISAADDTLYQDKQNKNKFTHKTQTTHNPTMPTHTQTMPMTTHTTQPTIGQLTLKPTNLKALEDQLFTGEDISVLTLHQ